jgi:hypothetical protein
MSNNPFEELKKEIIKWNYNFPLDKWWRKKYGIPFNSKKHKEISQIDILFEYHEDKLFEEINSPTPKIENSLSKEDEELFDKIKF